MNLRMLILVISMFLVIPSNIHADSIPPPPPIRAVHLAPISSSSNNSNVGGPVPPEITQTILLGGCGVLLIFGLIWLFDKMDT